MKVGIMSMQRIRNYGSFLQAYGLKRIIESLGSEVVFIDFEQQRELVENEERKKSVFKKILDNKNPVKYLKKKSVARKFLSDFDKDFIPRLCGNDYNYRDNTIDTLVIGSDEVFNCLQSFPVGYSKELFGEHYENKKVISYAASFGQTTLEGLKKYRIDSEIAELLKRFKAISVRDENSYEIVCELTGSEPEINLDPVLMYDFSKNVVDNVKISDYILIYTYPERLTKEEKKFIKKFAREKKKKIVSLGIYCDVADINLVVDPMEIMPYFSHADFIITDTFHGSIFSVKTHSKFCTIVRNGKNGNNNKLVDLLRRLNKEEVIVDSLDKIEELYDAALDYTDTDKIIEREKSKTRDYLIKALCIDKAGSL